MVLLLNIEQLWLDRLNIWPDEMWNASGVMLKHRFDSWDTVLNCDCPIDLPNEFFLVLVCHVIAFLFTLLRILEICTVTSHLGPLQCVQQIYNQFQHEVHFNRKNIFSAYFILINGTNGFRPW